MIQGRTWRFLLALAVLASLGTWMVKLRSRQLMVAEPPHEAPAGPIGSIDGKSKAADHEAGPAGSQPVTGRTPPELTPHDPSAMPGWAVGFGQEFWRGSPTETQDDLASPAVGPIQKAPFDTADVIARVRHAFVVDAAGSSGEVRADAYAARVDERGLRFSPHQPADAMPGFGWDAASAGETDGEPAPGRRSIPQHGALREDPSTEIRFHTVSVHRDAERVFDNSMPTGGQPWTTTGNTAQRLLSAQWRVVEHFEATDGGMAVTWVFQNPLPGSGPLDVAFEIEGLGYAGATQQGHHFADASGTARVRVGQAFAVDAAGSRWELAMDAAGDGSGRLHVSLPAEIQSEAVYPLAIDPVIGPEFGMDLPLSGPASGNQGNAAVAAGPTGYLVVWEDNRNGGNTSRDIYGARVSNLGTVLDPLGIAIANTTSDQLNPAVAFSKGIFLVAWADSRLGGSDIFAARLTSLGVVLDPVSIAVSADPNSQTRPAVAGGNGEFLVVWQDDRNNGPNGLDVYGARVTTAGAVLDPLGFGICTNNADQTGPTAGFDGTGFFVAWEDTRNTGTTGTDLYATRVSAAGAVLDPNSIALSTATRNQLEPAIASSGTNLLVVWRDRRNTGATGDDIFGTRVTTTGNVVTVLDPAGIGISTNNATQRTPAVAPNGTGFIVAWRDARNSGTTGDDIYAARVGADGSVPDVSGIIVCTNALSQIAPAMAGNASGVLVLWTDPLNPTTGNDILGARLNTNGVLLDTNHFVVSLSGAAQSSPAVAYNGTNYLVVWEDQRNALTNGIDILGTRVSASGKIVDLHGLRICALATDQRRPAVAVSGGDFLVAWEDHRNEGSTGIDIYGSRVTSGGTVADPGGLAISTAANDQNTPVVSGNSTTFLVAWQDSRTGGSAPDIYCTRVSAGGVVVNAAGVVVANTGQQETSPQASATENGFLVVWQQGNNDLLGARVNNAGSVLDPSGSSIPICAQGSSFTPSIAAAGTNFLVAWMDDRSSGDTGFDVYAGRVMGDGTVLDPAGLAVCTQPGDQVNPVAVGTPRNYVVIWQDQSVGNHFMSARVGTNGAVLDPWAVPLAGTADSVTPAAAADSSGKILLVGESFRRNSSRVDARLITGEPQLLNATVQFTAPVYTVIESGKNAKVGVNVKGKFSGVVTVEFATSDGTAVAGSDYLPTVTRLTFGLGKTAALISVPILNDAIHEANETVILSLRSVNGGAVLGALHAATLTILDDDP